MTKQGFSYISLIVDRSGSMSTIKTDMEGALNDFLVNQKTVPGECQVSLYQFDNYYEVEWEHRDIATVPTVHIRPRGSTALLDAVGKTINEMGEHFRFLHEDDRPEKVIVVIVTDGQENSSKEFSRSRIKEMIKHQEDVYGWAFTYIGANQDAYGEAFSFGVASAMNYGANYAGTRAVAQSLSSAVTRTRMAGGPANASYGYTQEEQDAADATVTP